MELMRGKYSFTCVPGAVSVSEVAEEGEEEGERDVVPAKLPHDQEMEDIGEQMETGGVGVVDVTAGFVGGGGGVAGEGVGVVDVTTGGVVGGGGGVAGEGGNGWPEERKRKRPLPECEDEEDEEEMMEEETALKRSKVQDSREIGALDLLVALTCTEPHPLSYTCSVWRNTWLHSRRARRHSRQQEGDQPHVQANMLSDGIVVFEVRDTYINILG